MPLLNFHIFEGRDGDTLRSLLDAAHQAMVEAFDVPITDRYQTVTQHGVVADRYFRQWRSQFPPISRSDRFFLPLALTLANRTENLSEVAADA